MTIAGWFLTFNHLDTPCRVYPFLSTYPAHPNAKSTSTLHCRGKNGSSKKIGQMTQQMIHFVPHMYVSGKISALRPCTQTVKNFWNSKKIRKLPKHRDFRMCGLLRFFCGCLRVFCGFFARVLRVFSLIVWGAANIVCPLSHQVQKHAIKVLKSKI